MSITSQSEKNIERFWYIYIVRCSKIYLYTGISPDVKKRVIAHKSGKGAKFTKNRYPIELVYVSDRRTLSEALKEEQKIKKYSKLKKEQIILDFQSNLSSIIDLNILEFLSVNDN